MNNDVSTIRSYFIDTARIVFDDYFADLGVEEARVISVSCLRYETSAWFAEIVYFSEEYPKYSPRVMFGGLPELNKEYKRNRIDIYNVVPRFNKELSDYNLLWRYTNPEEMQRVFTRIREEILKEFCEGYFRNPNELRKLVNERWDELDEEWNQTARQHNATIYRRQAEEAFRNKRYSEAVSFYEKIHPEKMTSLDQKKLEFSRKRTNIIPFEE